VLAEGQEEVSAVAGAWVASADGRRVTADAQGRFSWTGDTPAGGVWLAGAPGHVSSLVSGYAPEGAVALHLQPLALPVANRPTAGFKLVTLRGTVQDSKGAAVGGAAVVLGGVAVGAANVAYADAAGRFALNARVDPAGGAATLIASEGRGVAVVSGLALTGKDQEVAPVRLTPATHDMEVRVAGVADLPLPTVVVKVVASDGTEAVLAPAGGRVRLAELSGARYDLRIEARAADGSAYSLIERPGIAPDWTQPGSVREEALLAPPTFEPPVPLALGATLAWAPVAGAVGYTVRVTAPRSSDGWPWEAFAASPRLTLSLPGGSLEPGLYRVGVSGWDAPGATARALAQASGVRALRRVDRSKGLRVAYREVSFTQ
jgi:hypothetical protein